MARKLIVLLLMLFQGMGFGSPFLVNAVAGKVGDQLITVQDAYLYRGLQRFRSGIRPFVLIETDKILKNTVQKTMFEQMILLEAKAVGFKDPEPNQALQLLKKVKAEGYSKDWNQLLKTFGISEEDGLRRLQQGLVAEKFLKKKVENLAPVITDSELDQYIKNYPDRAKKLGEKNRSLIAEALKKEKVDKGLQDYIDFLSEKYSAAFLLS